MSATRVWFLLMALTLMSVLLAERAHWVLVSIPAMFVIAALKAELVIAHYMEIGLARSHWRVAYRLWVSGITAMLIAGHLIG